MKKIAVGVVLPAYNEADVIADVLRHIPAEITVKGKGYAITPIVVDDGSRDATAAQAETVKHVVVIRHLLNSGVGAATRTGLAYARSHGADYAATMDSDGQHSGEDLKKVLEAVISGSADLVIGSRLLETDRGDMPWYKILGNKGLNLITVLLLGVRSTDSQSGLKAFNRIAMEKVSYRENGYAFCSELLWRTHRAGLRITEVPIRAIYTDYSKLKGQSNWSAFQIIKQLVKHRLSDLVHE